MFTNKKKRYILLILYKRLGVHLLHKQIKRMEIQLPAWVQPGQGKMAIAVKGLSRYKSTSSSAKRSVDVKPIHSRVTDEFIAKLTCVVGQMSIIVRFQNQHSNSVRQVKKSSPAVEELLSNYEGYENEEEIDMVDWNLPIEATSFAIAFKSVFLDKPITRITLSQKPKVIVENVVMVKDVPSGVTKCLKSFFNGFVNTVHGVMRNITSVSESHPTKCQYKATKAIPVPKSENEKVFTSEEQKLLGNSTISARNNIAPDQNVSFFGSEEAVENRIHPKDDNLMEDIKRVQASDICNTNTICRMENNTNSIPTTQNENYSPPDTTDPVSETTTGDDGETIGSPSQTSVFNSDWEQDAKEAINDRSFTAVSILIGAESTTVTDVCTPSEVHINTCALSPLMTKKTKALKNASQRGIFSNILSRIRRKTIKRHAAKYDERSLEDVIKKLNEDIFGSLDDNMGIEKQEQSGYSCINNMLTKPKREGSWRILVQQNEISLDSGRSVEAIVKSSSITSISLSNGREQNGSDHKHREPEKDAPGEIRDFLADNPDNEDKSKQSKKFWRRILSLFKCS